MHASQHRKRTLTSLSMDEGPVWHRDDTGIRGPRYISLVSWAHTNLPSRTRTRLRHSSWKSTNRSSHIPDHRWFVDSLVPGRWPGVDVGFRTSEGDRGPCENSNGNFLEKPLFFLARKRGCTHDEYARKSRDYDQREAYRHSMIQGREKSGSKMAGAGFRTRVGLSSEGLV